MFLAIIKLRIGLLFLIFQSFVHSFKETTECSTSLFHLFHDGFPAILEYGGSMISFIWSGWMNMGIFAN